MGLLASFFVFEEFLFHFGYFYKFNSVQHDREDFRQIGGVVLGERGV